MGKTLFKFFSYSHSEIREFQGVTQYVLFSWLGEPTTKESGPHSLDVMISTTFCLERKESGTCPLKSYPLHNILPKSSLASLYNFPLTGTNLILGHRTEPKLRVPKFLYLCQTLVP
jgi:hypothetical protein